jgi:small subunit ribosomal protein S11
MGKKKIATAENEETKVTEGGAVEAGPKVKLGKKRFDSGILNIESTYNNTKVVLADPKGNVLAWSTSGAIGFKGAKKGTPFAAAKIGEVVGEKAQTYGIKEVKVVVKGVGSGRESAIRGFISKGINLTTISDMTPNPHNGPKPPKPRRA